MKEISGGFHTLNLAFFSILKGRDCSGRCNLWDLARWQLFGVSNSRLHSAVMSTSNHGSLHHAIMQYWIIWILYSHHH